jgi:hypothetical protein
VMAVDTRIELDESLDLVPKFDCCPCGALASELGEFCSTCSDELAGERSDGTPGAGWVR